MKASVEKSFETVRFQKCTKIGEQNWYRVKHRLADLYRFDFDFAYSTVCLILLGYMRAWQDGLNRRARQVEHTDQIRPNPGPRADGSPCIDVRITRSMELITPQLARWLASQSGPSDGHASGFSERNPNSDSASFFLNCSSPRLPTSSPSALCVLTFEHRFHSSAMIPKKFPAPLCNGIGSKWKFCALTC